MIYKEYVIFPVYNHYKIVDMEGNFIANVDSYEEAKEEIDNEYKC